MDPTRDLITAAREWAGQVEDPADAQSTVPRNILLLFEHATSSQRAEAVSALCIQARECLDRSPLQARSLAHVAHEFGLAGGITRGQAEAALLFAVTSNRLGEVRHARGLAEEAASLYAQRGESELAALSLCESAWASALIGDLQQALAETKRARVVSSSPTVRARCNCAEAHILRDQARYEQAEGLLSDARSLFLAVQSPLEAMRCERELAYGYILGERGEAFPILDRVRRAFKAAGCILDAAVCDYLLAANLNESGRYPQAVELLLSTRRTFMSLGAGFYSAWCGLELGAVYRHLNRFAESLESSRQARDYFLSHGVNTLVSACDINLGGAFYASNRYDEALAHYQEAAALSVAQGREARAARLYINMGLVYAKQGLYSQALDLHHRALQISTSKDLPLLTAGSHVGLAACYRELGQYEDALAHLRSAEAVAGQHPHRQGLIQNDIDLAEIHLALGETSQAAACLEQARSTAQEDGLDSLVALCDRLLADACVQTADYEPALARVENARALFAKHGQTVDAACCDLTQGELYLQRSEIPEAQEYFQRARAVLLPAFPDLAWRTDYGLGRCADKANSHATALDHYLCAVRAIADARSAIVTEQLSNDFFARRHSIYEQALSLALRLQQPEAVLEIVEARKARTFLTLIQRRGWKVRGSHSDPYVAGLAEREKHLRYQLNDLRDRLAIHAAADVGEAFRSGAQFTSISTAAFQELNALSQAYESIATQLRLATTGLAGAATPLPFSLEKFRDAAKDTWGSDWAALDYCLGDESLAVVVASPDRLETIERKLTPFDRAALEKCTRPDSDIRELVYRGTLRGDPVPSSGIKYLKHLHTLLIPPGLTAETLIVSPHGSLHGLPFHALMEGESCLIERNTVVYTPSLQALQHLLKQPRHPTISRSLALGVSQFGERARPLPFALAEVEQLRELFDGRGQSLWEDEATRRRLLDLSDCGELETFDLVHLATHAVLDPTAPHQSRVLLHDDAITAMDILDLSLNARLVTLSACQTALGEGGQGDEWLGLARAFFYAGAQGLLATLWPVEDDSMVQLTGRFYRHYAAGEDAAVSLRQAEIEMLREGHSPYQWAPFVLIGRP